MQNRKKIIKIYKQSVDKNLEGISTVLKNSNLYSQHFLSSYETVLKKTSEKIVRKWRSGKKYLRTEFALMAFNQHYPPDLLKLSIEIDAMINILDDLLDENLEKEEKIAHILEYLRTFSNYSFNKSNSNFQINMGQYFNKLITLALAERWLLAQAATKNNLNAIVKLSYDLLRLRSHDIDIFVEIALFTHNKKLNDQSEIMKIGRIFRAVNILKKDIFDLEHDEEQGQETLITFMRNQNKFDFQSYVCALIAVFEKKANKVEFRFKSNRQKVPAPIQRFKKMLILDKKRICDHLDKTV